LEPRLSEWTQEFTDTADYFESDRIANGLLDLVQFKFWQDVEVGWRYAVPLFVESWQYNRDWQKQLLGIIGAFQVRFDRDSKKRLQIFAKDLGYYSFDTDSRKDLLDELEKLAKRGWFDGARKNERMAILSLQRGRLLYELANYLETLQAYIDLELQLSQTMLRLQKDLGQEFERIGVELNQIAFMEGSLVAPPESLTAFQHAVSLNSDSSIAWGYLGASKSKEKEIAISYLQKAFNLSQQKDTLEKTGWSATIDAIKGNYESIIPIIRKAIDLNPKFAGLHVSLGSAYQAQGEYELAIASYQQAIALAPKLAFSYNGLGDVYTEQGKYELAIAPYQQAITLNPKFALSYHNLGYVYTEQGKYELAISSYQQAITLDPKFAYSKFSLGIVMGLQGNQKEAIILWKQGLEILTGNPQFDHLLRALYEVGIGKIERGTNCLREILETEKPPLGILSKVLKGAELMARFPTKLEGIDTVVEMLRQAIEKTQ
jgi:tetratricopeptide (TPR) repeat protein